MAKEIYLIAEAGRPKQVLEKWREDMFAADGRLKAYMEEIGAVGAFRLPFEKPGAFKFPRNEAPEGWTKPTRNGASRPKKSNHDAIAKLEGIEWCNSLTNVVCNEIGLPHSVHGEAESWGRSSHGLSRGTINTFSVCWTAYPGGRLSDVILIAPDAHDAVEKIGLDPESLTWLPEGTSPSLPAGMRAMTEAEVDLMFAQAKVAREVARKALEEEASPSP
jgi:hypothetical protein